MLRLVRLIGLMVVLLIWGGCTLASAPTATSAATAPMTPTEAPVPTIDPDVGAPVSSVPTIDPATTGLAGTTWWLDLFWSAEPTPVAQRVPTGAGKAYVTFHRYGEIEGFDSCNPYFGGHYEIRPGRLLTIDLGHRTLMRCSRPREVMDVEGRFKAALGGTASYQFEGAQLQLFDRAGRPLMSLRQSTS